MKVKELIARLHALDPEMEVTTASPEFGLVHLQLVSEVNAVEIAPALDNSAKYRPARRVDRAKQVTVLCCGPVDPGYFGHLSDR